MLEASGRLRPFITWASEGLKVKHAFLFGFVLLLTGCASTPTAGSFYNRGVDAYKAKNYKDAVDQWSKAVDAGDATAKNNLAYLLFFGLGTEKQPDKAIELWNSAAAAGESESQWHLGNIYAEGTGVEKNLITAYAWYRCAIASAEAHSREPDNSTESSIAEDARKSLVGVIDKLSASEIERGQVLAMEYIKKYAPTQPSVPAESPAVPASR